MACASGRWGRAVSCAPQRARDSPGRFRITHPHSLQAHPSDHNHQLSRGAATVHPQTDPKPLPGLFMGAAADGAEVRVLVDGIRPGHPVITNVAGGHA